MEAAVDHRLWWSIPVGSTIRAGVEGQAGMMERKLIAVAGLDVCLLLAFMALSWGLVPLGTVAVLVGLGVAAWAWSG